MSLNSLGTLTQAVFAVEPSNGRAHLPYGVLVLVIILWIQRQEVASGGSWVLIDQSAIVTAYQLKVPRDVEVQILSDEVSLIAIEAA